MTEPMSPLHDPAIQPTAAEDGSPKKSAASIVVGHDGSVGAERALTFAAVIAESLRVPVTIARVWGGEPQPPSLAQLIEEPRSFDSVVSEVTEQLVSNCESVTNEHPDLAVAYAVAHGSASQVLCELSQHERMLVIGSRGLGSIAGLLLGSVGNHCLHQSKRPVLVVPRSEHPITSAKPSEPTSGPSHLGVSTIPQVAPGSIVVGFDGSQHSKRALTEALDLAEQMSAPVVVIQSWSIDTAPKGSIWKEGYVSSYPEINQEVVTQLEHDTGAIEQAYGHLAIQHRAVLGHPAEVLVRASESAMMLVVGSRGRGGFTGLVLGSVSTHCAQRAQCPVLVVPPEIVPPEDNSNNE